MKLGIEKRFFTRCADGDGKSDKKPEVKPDDVLNAFNAVGGVTGGGSAKGETKDDGVVIEAEKGSSSGGDK